MKMTISPEPALLGFLRGGPIHGYELYKRVTEELAPVWHLGLSQMYAIVNDYAARGWIKTRVEVQDLRPAKKVLELTPEGRRAFKDWLTQPAHGLREFRVDFFLRLYFARAAGSPQAQRLIEQQIAATHHELEYLQALCTSTESDPDTFSNQVRRFRIEQLTTIMNWLKTNRDALAPFQKTRRLNPSTARRATKK